MTAKRRRERLDVLEAACYCAEHFGPEQVAVVDYSSPFPSVTLETHPKVQKWVSRIRRGVQEKTLSHYRQNGKPRGELLFREDDLDRWMLLQFQRKKAIA